MKISLSPREITVLSSALYTAREEFFKHAGTAKREGHPRIEEQFLAQSRDCTDMMEKMEAALDAAVSG